MIGGLQFDLAFRNRNQGAVAQATAETRAAESGLAAAAALVRAEVQAARADYELRRDQLSTLLKPLLDQAGETYRIAEAAYREGGTDLLRLLDAQRVRIEAQMAYTRALAELRQSQVALRTALGEMP
jgi:outer membrane protein TolC